MNTNLNSNKKFSFQNVVNINLTNNFEINRKQDEEYISKKKNLIARVQKSAKNRMAKKTRSQLMKKRDYSTLLNSTKVWRERHRTQDLNTNEPKKLQYIKDVPRLYVS